MPKRLPSGALVFSVLRVRVASCGGVQAVAARCAGAMRRAAGLAKALARAGAAGRTLSAAWPPAAAPCAALACLGPAAAAQRALHAGAPLLPPAAAAAAADSRPGSQAGSRSLRTSGAAAAAQPAAHAPIAVPEPWRLVGRVDKPFAAQSRDIFAVVQAGPHQFKVTVDDLIYVEKMHGVDINDKARTHALRPCLAAPRTTRQLCLRALCLPGALLPAPASQRTQLTP